MSLSVSKICEEVFFFSVKKKRMSNEHPQDLEAVTQSTARVICTSAMVVESSYAKRQRENERNQREKQVQDASNAASIRGQNRRGNKGKHILPTTCDETEEERDDEAAGNTSTNKSMSTSSSPVGKLFVF